MRRKPIRARDGTLRGSSRLLLSRSQERAARQAWRRGEPQQEIARLLGISVDTLRARLRDQLANLPPRGSRNGSGRRPEDPTEEEIYGRLTLLEQAGWSDEERDQRWHGKA